MHKSQQKRKFKSMFYIGTAIILSPLLASVLILGISKCSGKVSDSITTSKKDSVKIVTKTVIVHDTIRIIEKPKKIKKKTEDTLTTVIKKEIITEKKDSI